ncbi:HbrB-domain-containing protein [Wallemia mellicola]|nr:HbrB-domain-containing protein [Wallemia mellicola]
MPSKPSDLRLNIPNSSTNLSQSIFPSSTPSKSQLLSVPPTSPASSRRLDPNSISSPFVNPSTPNPSTQSHSIHHSPRVHRFHRLASSSKPGNSSKYNPTSPSFAHAPSSANTTTFTSSVNPSGSSKGGLTKDISTVLEFNGDAWQALCVKVLPLFNGENMITPIEDLNTLVILHIKDTIARSKPSRVIESLSSDFNALISNGMLTLRAKLSQHVDEGSERLATRLTEIWTFFFGQVLPLLEGVFLPYSTDDHIQALSKSSTVNSVKANEGSNHNHSYSIDSDNLKSKHSTVASVMNVRKSVLRGFRDQLIIPLFSSLEKLFLDLCDDVIPATPTSGGLQSKQSLSSLKSAHQAIPDSLPSTAAAIAASSSQPTTSAFSPVPRLQQMTLVLSSIRAFDNAQDNVERLARILRRCYVDDVQDQPTSSSAGSLLFRSTQTSMSMSPFAERLLGKRRDRRGWIRKKSSNANASSTDDHLDDVGGGLYELSLEREPTQRDSEDEWLDTLRSPNVSPAYVSTPTTNTHATEKQRNKPPPIIAPRGSSLAFAGNADDASSSDEDDLSVEFRPVDELPRVSTQPDLSRVNEDDSNDSEGAEYLGQRLMGEGSRSSEEKTQETVVQLARSPVEDSLKRWERAQKELEEMLGMNDEPTPTLNSDHRFSKPLPPSPKLVGLDLESEPEEE